MRVLDSRECGEPALRQSSILGRFALLTQRDKEAEAPIGESVAHGRGKTGAINANLFPNP